MLVLLIIFMISAPLLTAGVPLELPKTEAAALQNQHGADHGVDQGRRRRCSSARAQVPFGELAPRISAIAGDGCDKPIFVRADGKATYATVAQVMAALSNAGFATINLLTDTGGPSSGATANKAAGGTDGADAKRPASGASEVVAR